jgi:hypothetical protein
MRRGRIVAWLFVTGRKTEGAARRPRCRASFLIHVLAEALVDVWRRLELPFQYRALAAE